VYVKVLSIFGGAAYSALDQKYFYNLENDSCLTFLSAVSASCKFFIIQQDITLVHRALEAVDFFPITLPYVQNRRISKFVIK